jgi:uncharacterized protein YqgC (DUF456 family)
MSKLGSFNGFFSYVGESRIIITYQFGALIGEILVRKREKSALRAGAGVFVGTLFGIMLKICVTGVIVYYFLTALGLWNSV